MVFVYCWPWCGCQKRSVNLSWAWSRHWKTNATVDSSQRLLDLNQEIGDEFFNFPGNKFGQKFLYVAVCVFIIVSQWSWPENPLQSDYIRWDWRCSEGCVLVLPYVRIDFSANQFYFALTKHKRAVCEVKFQTYSNSKNKNYFVRSRYLYLVSKEWCIAHRNFNSLKGILSTRKMCLNCGMR